VFHIFVSAILARLLVVALISLFIEFSTTGIAAMMCAKPCTTFTPTKNAITITAKSGVRVVYCFAASAAVATVLKVFIAHSGS